jgi:hypothetical protein
MLAYLVTDRKHATGTMTAIYGTLAGVTTRIENLGHRTLSGNFFSPDLFDSLHTKAINCCHTVRPNQNRMT